MSADADLSPPGARAAIVDFMDALGLETVTLVGNDTGGAICQLVAAEHPERVSRLVLTSCDLYDRFPPPLVQAARDAREDAGRDLADRPVAAAAVRAAPPDRVRLGDEAAPEKAVIDVVPEPGRASRGVRRDLGKVFGSVDAALHDRGRGEARRASTSRCCSRGRARTSCSRSSTPQARFARLPNATLEEIPDSYTFIAEDQPERLAEVIAAFVRRPAAVSA